MAARTSKGPATDKAPLHLRGLPRSLTLSSAVLAGHDCAELQLPDSLAAHADSATVSLPVRAKRDDGASVRLRLKRTAPPGRYAAKLAVGKALLDVDLDIAPAPQLSFFPPKAWFSAAPGQETALDVTITNIGNVAVDLPEQSVVGLFDDDGIEAAFVEAYRQLTDQPAEVFGTWLRSLRHGCGLLKLYLKGGGALLPGQERTVRIAARLPEELSPGQSCHGIWRLGPVPYGIGVTAQR